MISFIIHLFGGFTLSDIYEVSYGTHEDKRTKAQNHLPFVLNRVMKKIIEAKTLGRAENKGVCFSNIDLFPMPINSYSKFLLIKELEILGFHPTHLNFIDGLNVFWGEYAQDLDQKFGKEADTFEDALTGRIH